MLEEEAQHFLGGVGAAWVGEGAGLAAAEPGVAAALDGPVLGDGAAGGVEIECAFVAVAAGGLTLFGPGVG